MIWLLSLLMAGFMQGIMVSLNGIMSSYFSLFAVSFIVHGVALVLLLAYFPVRRQRIRILGAPWYVYTVGLFGMGIVALSSYCALRIGAAAALAMCIFGELISARLVDRFGLFGMKKIPFRVKNIPGYLLVVAGVIMVVLS